MTRRASFRKNDVTRAYDSVVKAGGKVMLRNALISSARSAEKKPSQELANRWPERTWPAGARMMRLVTPMFC